MLSTLVQKHFYVNLNIDGSQRERERSALGLGYGNSAFGMAKTLTYIHNLNIKWKTLSMEREHC